MDLKAYRARLLAAVASSLALGCSSSGDRRPQPAPTPVPIGDPEPVPIEDPRPDPLPEPKVSCADGAARRHCLKPNTPPVHGGESAPDPSFSAYDANGCVPAQFIGHACNGLTVMTGPERSGAECCYMVCQGPIAPCGRPVVIAGEQRLAPVARRDDWSEALALAPADPSLQRALADAWLEDARLEHGSAAAFARFSLELLAVGAPARLIERAHRAALDEVRHARACFAAAEHHLGAPVGPGPLPLHDLAISDDLGAIVEATVIDGCVGETIGAALLARQAELCTDAVLARVLAAMSRDEAYHAELAWSFVGWALRVEPGLRPRVDRAFSAGMSEKRWGEAPPSADVRLERHGRLGKRTWLDTAQATLAGVIEPCRRALLA